MAPAGRRSCQGPGTVVLADAQPLAGVHAGGWSPGGVARAGVGGCCLVVRCSCLILVLLCEFFDYVNLVSFFALTFVVNEMI